MCWSYSWELSVYSGVYEWIFFRGINEEYSWESSGLRWENKPSKLKKASLHLKLATLLHRDTTREDLSAAGVWPDHQARVCILCAFRVTSVQVLTVQISAGVISIYCEPFSKRQNVKVRFREISLTELVLDYVWREVDQVMSGHKGRKELLVYQGKNSQRIIIRWIISFRVKYINLI